MKGRLLVGAQFALIGWLVWPFTPQVWSPAALTLLCAAVALGAWTLAHNRIGNFNIRPEPRASGRLVTGGPYRHIRHPMYAALLLFSVAAAVAYADAWKAVACVLMFAVLWLKAGLEERALRQRYVDYAAYADRTRRFIPWLV